MKKGSWQREGKRTIDLAFNLSNLLMYLKFPY